MDFKTSFFNNCAVLGIGTRYKKLLVAVSGGIDSMVLLHLMQETKAECAAAHMNFQLRGDESNGDEQMVADTCEKAGIMAFTKKVDTIKTIKEWKTNIQLAARRLRYEWFAELAEKHGFDAIVTAHQATDNAETMLINLMRGTGVEGLAGIKAINGMILRPLLPFSRDDIEGFALENGIKYREDSSNKEDKYLRNRLRHHVFPVLKEINPRYEEKFLQTAGILQQVWQLVQLQLAEFEKYCVKSQGDKELILPKHEVLTFPQYEVMLYYFLNKYGFNAYQVKEIADALQNHPGQRFNSPAWQITNDREGLILQKLEEVDSGFEMELAGPGTYYLPHGLIKVELLNRNAVRMTDSNNIALLDALNCNFPLVARNRCEGDAFTPLGMTGTKLLSDFFTDEKVRADKKNKIPVILSNNEIIWVAGYRISHLHKISATTDKVLRISWLPAAI